MQKHVISRRPSALVLWPLLLFPVFAGGCLVAVDSEQRHSGNYVADTTFAQVKAGKSAGFVRATLGAPTKITAIEDGSELWDYIYTETHESSGAVFLVFGGHDVKESSHHAFVELKNGVVSNAWRG